MWWIEGRRRRRVSVQKRTNGLVVSFKFHFAVSLLCNIIFVVLFRIKLITQKQKKKTKTKTKTKNAHTLEKF